MNIIKTMGFGDGKKRSVMANIAHEILQTPYRRMVQQGPDFDSLKAIAKQSTKDCGIRFSLDVLRQVLTLADLKSKKLIKSNQNAIVIGDGFGSLTSLLLQSGLANKVVLVNLRKTLFVDISMLLQIPFFQESGSISLAQSPKDIKQAMANETVKVIAVEATNSSILHHSNADIAFNIASMQEMDMKSINEYFDQFRKIATSREFLFYCCNREKKRLPDGSWIVFNQYPWSGTDKHFFDEPCPWHQFYYKVFPPSYRNYDGRLMHRFTRIGPSS